MLSKPLQVFLASIFCTAIASGAESQPTTEAPNWCAQAEASLTDREGKDIKCGSVNKRCVRINNYWCQKHGSSPWRGTPGVDGANGNRDADGHAIFGSVEWSVRAVAIDIRAKYRRGLISAVQIASQYSPWCDTLGSKAVVMESGRTCKDGRAAPPPSFSGRLCEVPKATNPTAADCKKGCNCPPEIAATLVMGLEVDVNADLKLFDSNGKPLPNLVRLLRNLALQEQGIYVKQSVVEAGISKLSQ
jgi:hypothetical protein